MHVELTYSDREKLRFRAILTFLLFLTDGHWQKKVTNRWQYKNIVCFIPYFCIQEYGSAGAQQRFNIKGRVGTSTHPTGQSIYLSGISSNRHVFFNCVLKR